MMRKFEFYGVGKVGPKGQVVIPAEAREELGFRPGDKVMVMGVPGEQSVIVMNEETFNKHLKHMQKHYESMGRILNSQKLRTKKIFDD
ncbi:AbrB/MazE/SpoVT family DNA-binding domain-containing protein [Candidatus Saccharibacteria bacterium]|nr:AbrB/MazE/SpoVT family DNA-binding domain-containing protein [Candidatus Saccharibacteria bacterium]